MIQLKFISRDLSVLYVQLRRRDNLSNVRGNRLLKQLLLLNGLELARPALCVLAWFVLAVWLIIMIWVLVPVQPTILLNCLRLAVDQSPQMHA